MSAAALCRFCSRESAWCCSATIYINEARSHGTNAREIGSQVGNEFSSVEALWSQFENVMAQDEDRKEEEKEQEEGEES